MPRYAIRDGNNLIGAPTRSDWPSDPRPSALRSSSHRARCRRAPGHRAPAGLNAAGGRNGNGAAGARKRLRVDLGMAQPVRAIRDPFPVGRKLSVAFVEHAGRDGERLTVPGVGHRQRPQVGTSLGIDTDVQQKPTVVRPVLRREQRLWRREQSVSAPLRSPPVPTICITPVCRLRAKGQSSTVGRPDRIEITGGIVGQPSHAGPHRLQHEDVPIAFGVGAIEGDTGAVRGQVDTERQRACGSADAAISLPLRSSHASCSVVPEPSR